MLITQGAKGALVIRGAQQELIAGTPVQPVDTTGAGDAFVGGLLTRLSKTESWVNDETIRDAVRWANGCGALATTQKGAMTALPNESALLEYIK